MIWRLIFATVLVLSLGSCDRKGELDPLSEASSQLGQRLGSRVDGKRILATAQAQVDFGARPSGSTELAQCRNWLVEQLEAQGWSVVRQEFTAQTPQGSKNFVNIRARFGAGARDWSQPVGTLYGAHYDTKYFKDIEFLGANDGASAVAVLLEVARVLAIDEMGRPLAGGLEIVLFDGEEGIERIDQPTRESMALPLAGDGLWGSRYYVSQVIAKALPEPGRVVLWDIVGDGKSALQVSRDARADLLSPLQSAANQLQGKGLDYTAGAILDDHVPFMLINRPATVVIQGDLLRSPDSYWHTERDIMETLDPEALAHSARIALQFLGVS